MRISDWSSDVVLFRSSGCAARNPDHHAYAELFAAIRNQFFVVSIADLQDGAEWIVGNRVNADIQMHRGELDLETNAALTKTEGMMFSSPGFAVNPAQSVGTPSERRFEDPTRGV